MFWRSAWQLAAALTLLGTFSAIYHPVGIPMLLQHSTRPGNTIGWSGLSGNLGIAVAAALTGLLVAWPAGARPLPCRACITLALGLAFARLAPPEHEPPARRTQKAAVPLPNAMLARVFAVMTLAAITSSVLFNFTTNGNGQLMAERLRGLVDNPSKLGLLLAAGVRGGVAGAAGRRPADRPLPAQAAVPGHRADAGALAGAGRACAGLVDLCRAGGHDGADLRRHPVHRRDDRALRRRPLRSRVAGMRLTVAFGFSSGAVWLLGPLVKANGFTTMMLVMAGVAALSACAVVWLPGEDLLRQPAPAT
jgi:hypothetical protein